LSLKLDSGWAVYKKTANILLATAIAVVLMSLTVALGSWLHTAAPAPTALVMPTIAGLPTGIWTIIVFFKGPHTRPTPAEAGL
jgi:hypothetical protein